MDWYFTAVGERLIIMFNDRDLGVLGAGALLAVMCLVLPLPLVGKVVLGLSVLVGFILLALLRLGPDRIPLEVWLLRRIRFRLQARRYTYQQPNYAHKRSWRLRRPRTDPAPSEDVPEPSPAPFADSPAFPLGESYHPLTLALDEVGVYPLVTVLLAVIGIYFLAWLAQDGAAEVEHLMGGFFQ
jgi:hypothetical protein